MSLDVISHSGSSFGSSEDGEFLLLVPAPLLISLHFLLHFQFFLQFQFNSHLSLSLSSLLSLTGWERCTSTSKTKTASLFCRRGGWTDRVRQTDREKDGIRWWEGKRWNGNSRSRRKMMWGGSWGFRKDPVRFSLQWVKTSQARPAEKVQFLAELQVNSSHTGLCKLLQKAWRHVRNNHSSWF